MSMSPYRSAFRRSRLLSGALLLVSLGATRAPAQEDRPDVIVDASVREAAIRTLAQRIDSLYPDAQIAARTSQALLSALGKRQYEDSSAKRTARHLTEDLRRWSGDPHFAVDYFVIPRPFPTPAGALDARSEADMQLAVRLQNFGFTRVERLAGNVGYIRMDRFWDPALAGPAAEAALRFVEGTDALIIDLRENGGGYPGMVRFLASHFFADEVRLSDRHGRSPADLQQSWTAVMPGPRYLDKPVFILSGPRTFSAAEAFAYDLQALHRAQVVGETTRGGANAALRLIISPRFGVILPSSRVVNSLTGSNWEGGLKPDVSTSAATALSTAHRLALDLVAPRHLDDPLTREIQDARAALVAAPPAAPRVP